MTVNFNTGEVIAENISLPINENKITTPILIKLLATSNVARSFGPIY
jgi:hypothetical protein